MGTAETGVSDLNRMLRFFDVCKTGLVNNYKTGYFENANFVYDNPMAIHKKKSEEK